MQTLKLNAYTRQFAAAAAARSENWRKPDVFDNASRFDCTFSQAVDRRQLGLEFICHLNFRMACWWWRGLLRKIRLPTGMMGCPSGGDVRLNVTRFMAAMLVALKYHCPRRSLGLPEQWDGVRLGWPQLDRWDGSTGCWPQSETVLFHSGVSIVMLIKAIVVAVFHDA